MLFVFNAYFTGKNHTSHVRYIKFFLSTNIKYCFATTLHNCQPHSYFHSKFQYNHFYVTTKHLFVVHFILYSTLTWTQKHSPILYFTIFYFPWSLILHSHINMTHYENITSNQIFIFLGHWYYILISTWLITKILQATKSFIFLGHW